MTPEAENELVARWMGWKKRSYPDPPMQASVFWDRRTDERQWIMTPPNYRTDPALNRELEERLMDDDSGPWVFHKICDEFTAENLGDKSMDDDDDDEGYIVRSTLAEALFAAAVMQAGKEGK